MAIHPTAVVDPQSDVGDVTVGPFAVIGAGAQLRDGVQVGPHVVFEGSCHIGEHTIVGPHAVIGPEAWVGANVQLGALCAVHAGCRVGRLAQVSAGAMCTQDVPPFSIAQGDRARLYGLNISGLRRAGVSDEVVTALKEAWFTLFVGDVPLRMAQNDVAQRYSQIAEVSELLEFVAASARGVARTGLSD